MSDYLQPEEEIVIEYPKRAPAEPSWKLALKHGGLFALTFASVSYAGILWVGRSDVHQSFWGLASDGALFAALLLGFLATHEFGHYFAARFHKVRASLPYFIPLPLLGIGTLGAVIRIKEPIRDSKKLFDIGIAGPLAGFVAALGILAYGFASLPSAEFINQFGEHEAVKAYVAEHGVYPEDPLVEGVETLFLGETILFSFIHSFFEEAPPMWEAYHYPFLFAGWLALFFTALNLTPVGQLDGGHIIFGLLGPTWHQRISRAIIFVLSILAGIGVMGSVLVEDPLSLGGVANGLYWVGWALGLIIVFRKLFKKNQITAILATSVSIAISGLVLWLGINSPESYLMWMIWLIFLTFFAGAEHPPVMIQKPLGRARKTLGWLSMFIYVICFTLTPIYSITP